MDLFEFVEINELDKSMVNLGNITGTLQSIGETSKGI